MSNSMICALFLDFQDTISDRNMLEIENALKTKPKWHGTPVYAKGILLKYKLKKFK